MGLGGSTLVVCLALLARPVAAGAAVPVPARPPIVVPAAPPSVPSGRPLVCTADWVVTLDQPISRVSSFGQFTSGGETGVIDCRGDVGGHPVTGPGTYGESGAFGPDPAGGADCSTGSGAADFTATLPTAAGPRHVGGLVSFYWAGPAGVVFDGRFPGAFRLSPGEGDCVNQPARQLHFQAGGLLFVDGGS